MAATYYRPRMWAVLDVPILGTRAERTQQEKSSQTLQLPVRPKRVRVESNDHNEADRCTITTDWTQAGVDPRMLNDAVVQVHLADADEFGYWAPSRENCRFVGNVKEVEGNRSIDEAAEVSLVCLDYTDLFLRAKPFGSKGIPAYSQTLEDAWRTIVSQTPGAEVLADRIRFIDVDGSITLGEAVAERFKKLGKVPTNPETDAWAVWQQCVGMLGLISFIRLDECIVTTATNYYTANDSPTLLWGEHLEHWSESRVSDVSRTGIGVTSFNVLDGKTIEAYYPPIGDERIQRKRARAKKIGDTDAMRQREKREFYAIPGIANVDIATRIAQRIYEERSRQELEGKATTKHMRITRESGQPFDLLDLSAGDTVEVRVRDDHRELLAALPSEAARVSYLEAQGYTEQVATLIAKNMEEFATLGSKFHVRSVCSELEYNDEGGSFSVDINYVNRITVSGGAEE